MTAVVLTPAYTHVHPDLHRAIRRSGLRWLPLYGHSDLPRVRSVLIGEGLTRAHPPADRLILIDADTIPTPEALGFIATTPLVTPQRALWGLYPLREGSRWSVCPEDPEGADAAIQEGRQFRITSGGLGFCAIHRESLERVAATLPMIVEDTGVTWHPFCVPIVRDTTYYADDGSLCLRLRESGTELWCDPTLRAAHAVETLLTEIRG